MQRQESKTLFACILLLVAVLAAYSNHFHNGFHYDDGHTIVNNSAIRDLRNIPLFFRDATTFSSLPSNQSYRPLVSTLLAIDYHLAHGLRPFWFQLSTFAIFLALILLLAFVIHHLLAKDGVSPVWRSRWLALAAAAAYALSPANADAVNYVIVSAELIAALGVLSSFAFYFSFPHLRRYLLYILPAAIAILAKPTAAIFPLLFVAYGFCFRAELRGRPARTWLWETFPPFLVCGTVLLFVQRMTPSGWIAGATSAHAYLVTQPYVALLYFKTFFWPLGLSADYDLVPFASASDPRLWIGFLFVISLGAGAMVASFFSRARLLGFGLLWFLITLLPTALFPLAEVMNDYRAFLADMGLVMALAGVAQLFAGRWAAARKRTKIALLSALSLVLCVSGYATFQRNKVWSNEETFWRDVASKSPHNGRGLMGYGIQLLNKGDYAGALDYFHRAQQFTPSYYLLLINLAVAENATGETAGAQRHFEEALRMAPSSPESYSYYARYLLAHARPEEARTLLLRALELSPHDVLAHELLEETQTNAAEAHTKQADILLRAASFKEAIAEYEAALAIAPTFPSALNGLAWLLATCPEASLRNGPRALQLARKADELARGKSPLFLRTLAAAYAETGRFDAANDTARHAWKLAKSQQETALSEALLRDGLRYRHNLPLHP